MFDNQTEPAFGTTAGVDPQIANLRNQLIVWCKHIATEASLARGKERSSALIDVFLLEALESASLTIPTSPRTLATLILKADYISQLATYLAEDETAAYQSDMEEQIRSGVQALTVTDQMIEDMLPQGEGFSNAARLAALGPDAFGMHETLLAALIGAASNARMSVALSEGALQTREFEAQGLRRRIRDEVKKLPLDQRKQVKEEWTREAEEFEAQTALWRQTERAVLDGIVDALAFLASEPTDLNVLVDYALKIGELNYNALETLRRGVTATYGVMTPTSVRASDLQGKCALFCGDDFDTLKSLLAAAEYYSVNIWTYGDAFAAHAFGAFNGKFRRLVGHYGGSWCNQRRDFDRFPGALVVSHAPIDEPSGGYGDYIFSVGETTAPGVQTVARKADGSVDWADVMRAANDSPGFFRTKPVDRLPAGFGGENELNMISDKLVGAYRGGEIKQIVVIGGQDFPNLSYDYFERLFDALAPETKALTFGDAQFRFLRKPCDDFSLQLPKIFNVGRERDAFAIFHFVKRFADTLERKADNLPISFFVSLWGEASIAVAFAFCSQGYRKVFVGPTAPKIWSPAIIEALQNRLGLRIASEPSDDLQAPSA